MNLRWISWLTSMGVHGAFVALLLVSAGSAAFEAGSGEDRFNVDQGVAVEGFSLDGQDAISVAAVEAEPLEASEARAAVEEVKAVEEVEPVEIVKSDDGPEQQEVIEEKPVEQPTPEQVATIEQQEQIAVEEKKAAGAAKTAGDTNSLNAYRGKLWSHISKNKLAPKTRSSGMVVVKFSIGADGQLVSSSIEKSSGNSLLDKAAIRMVEKASPFPALPDGISAQATFESTVPIRFN